MPHLDWRVARDLYLFRILRLPLWVPARNMRLLFTLISLNLLALFVACTGGGLAEPISLPVLPESTKLPPATELPTVTLLPSATELPSVVLPEAATELPPATPLPTATELPPATLLEEATPLPTAAELPTPEPATVDPVLPTVEPTPNMAQPQLSIGPATWPVELAITPEDRNQGLSGREVLPEGTGMLFVFESDQHLTFWMPDMNFPLDMVWIDSSCHVVDVTLDAPVPLPGQSRADLPRFSPQSPARFALEINAGEFEAAGIQVGAMAVLEGELSSQYGC